MHAHEDVSEITVITARFGPVFDRGLLELLRGEAGIRVLQCGLDLSEIEIAVARETSRVAILGDMALASSSVLRRLRGVQPSIGLVVLLHGLSEHDGRQLLAFGATACVAQEASWPDISAAVRLSAEGKHMLVPAASQAQLSVRGSTTLTPREWEVFQLVQVGQSNLEIAQALQIGVETVRSHIQKSNRKLGVVRRRGPMTLARSESSS